METPPNAFRGQFRTDSDALDRASRDRSHLVQRPAAVAFPLDTDDVVTLVGWARRHRVPLVARGGGTSLDGETVPPPEAVVVDLSGWQRIREVDAGGRWARVDPGVVNFALHRELAPKGMFFPPNPGSWTECTIGGNVATNASGPRSFRYGATRRWVRELTAVTGAGDLVTVGTLARKRSAGPEILELLVGSEGTLAIFTEVVVGLAPSPGRRTGWIVPVAPSTDLARVALGLATPPDLGLSAVEYLDARLTRSIAGQSGSRLPGDRALLLLELEAADEAEEMLRLQRLESALQSSGITETPEIYADVDRMWTVRGQAGVALDREFGARVREDVAVPLPRLGELLRAIAEIASTYRVESAVFAHLGEGSVHPNFAISPADPRADRLRSELLAVSRRLGGTISAEHGIGRVKRPHVWREHGEAELRLWEGVRRTFDPDGILNPGALYPRAGEGPPPSGSPSAGAADGTRPG